MLEKGAETNNNNRDNSDSTWSAIDLWEDSKPIHKQEDLSSESSLSLVFAETESTPLTHLKEGRISKEVVDTLVKGDGNLDADLLKRLNKDLTDRQLSGKTFSVGQFNITVLGLHDNELNLMDKSFIIGGAGAFQAYEKLDDAVKFLKSKITDLSEYAGLLALVPLILNELKKGKKK
jgi:hypothetical protein